MMTNRSIVIVLNSVATTGLNVISLYYIDKLLET